MLQDGEEREALAEALESAVHRHGGVGTSLKSVGAWGVCLMPPASAADAWCWRSWYDLGAGNSGVGVALIGVGTVCSVVCGV